MATLATMKSRIANELARDNLTSEIANAITDSIAFHETERFWFNQTRTLTFSTVASQIAYGASDQARIPYLVRIDRLYFTQTGQIYDLDRYEPADFELVSSSTTAEGKPTCYTYVDSTIRLWPTPNDAYTMRMYALYKFADISADGDTNAWTTEAEELIRTAAKLRICLDVTKDYEAASAMQAKMPVLLERLRSETSQRLSTGVIVATQF